MPDKNDNISNDIEFEEQNNDETTISFDDSELERSTSYNGYPEDNSSDNEPDSKKPKRISIKTLVVSIIAAVVAAIMLTYSICSSLYQSMCAKAYVDANKIASQNQNSYSELDLIAQIMNSLSYDELNHDEMMTAAIKAYVEQSGDVYASYYSEEELKAAQKQSQEASVGIGISIIDDELTYKDKLFIVIKIVDVIEGSPAFEKGIKTGDLIWAIEINGEKQYISNIGSEKAYAAMKGAVGTEAKFYVLRKNGESYEEIPFSITRREITSVTVYPRVYTKNSEIGIIRISDFNDTTPSQFENAVESLKAKGCKKFVLDLRYNTGGALDSMEKLLSFFLEKGKTFVQFKDNQGNITPFIIKETSNFASKNSPCSIKAGDVGKYKDLNIVILCNEYTASASEIFISALRDHNITNSVGTKTYGKGVIQSTFALSSLVEGMTGAISLTTDEALSPKGNSFNKNGITPDQLIPLSDEAKKYSIYELTDDLDNQLQEAIKFFK